MSKDNIESQDISFKERITTPNILLPTDTTEWAQQIAQDWLFIKGRDEKIKQNLKDWVKANGPIKLPSGFVIDNHPGNQSIRWNSIEQKRELWDKLRDLEVASEDIWECLSFSITKLKELAKAKGIDMSELHKTREKKLRITFKEKKVNTEEDKEFF